MGQARVTRTETAPALLETVADIDAAWIGAVLGRAVRSVRAEPVGHGTSSMVARLHLRHAPGEDGPASVIAKFAQARAERSTAAIVVAGFAREVAAYRHFGADTPFRIPHCHHAEIDGEGTFNLILEDLDAGCRPGDQIAGCSVPEARAVVHELAGLHGAWWRSPVLDTLDWPRRRESVAAQSAAVYARGAAKMRARFAGTLGPARLAVIEAALPLIEGWNATAPAAASLIHADARVDNMMFEDRAEGVRACLIDLQSIAVGDPANDLAYFLAGSLDPADRAACERDLVAAHAAQIRATGADYSDARAWDLYRGYAIAGMAGTVMAAGLVGDNAHNDRLLMTLATRNIAAVEALDGLTAAAARIAQGRA